MSDDTPFADFQPTDGPGWLDSVETYWERWFNATVEQLDSRHSEGLTDYLRFKIDTYVGSDFFLDEEDKRRRGHLTALLNDRLNEWLPTMGQRRYQEYLCSREWRGRRWRTLIAAGHMCEKCGATAQEVHHVTYERLGNERPEDLLVLCRACHADIHGKEP